MFARCLFSVERRLLHVADCTLPVQAAGAVSCIDASQALWERLTSGAVSAKRYQICSLAIKGSPDSLELIVPL
jgi:hypothetical protein